MSEANTLREMMYDAVDNDHRVHLDTIVNHIDTLATCGDDALDYVNKWRTGDGSFKRINDCAYHVEVVMDAAGLFGIRITEGCITICNGLVSATFHSDLSNCGLGHMHNITVTSGNSAVMYRMPSDHPVRVAAVTVANKGDHCVSRMIREYAASILGDTHRCEEQAFKLIAAVLLTGGMPCDIGRVTNRSRSSSLRVTRKGIIRFSGPRLQNRTYDFGCWMMKHFPEHVMVMPFFSRNPNSGNDLMEFIVSPTSLAVQNMPFDINGGSTNTIDITGHYLGALNIVGL